jgi:hypothetical protein
MFKSIKEINPGKHTMKRTANVIADSLMNEMLLDRKGKKSQNYFCTAYATSALQGSIFRDAIESDTEYNESLLVKGFDRKQHLSRKVLAKEIYRRIKTGNRDTDIIARTYWSDKNVVCRLKGLTTSSYHAMGVLDRMSDPAAAAAA